MKKKTRTQPNRRRLWTVVIAGVVVLALLAAAWRYTPLSEFITPDAVRGWAEAFRGLPGAPLLLILSYTPAQFLMVPRDVLTLFSVIAFGPWLGFTYAMAGIIVSSVVAYYVGRTVSPKTIERWAGGNMDRLKQVLRKHGVMAVFTLRVLPTAPFVIESMACGAFRVKLWEYIVGTAMGMAPGTLAFTVFGQQITAALEDPSKINYWIIGGTILVLLVLMYFLRRYLSRK